MLVTIHRCSEIQEVEEVGGVVPEKLEIFSNPDRTV